MRWISAICWRIDWEVESVFMLIIYTNAYSIKQKYEETTSYLIFVSHPMRRTTNDRRPTFKQSGSDIEPAYTPPGNASKHWSAIGRA